MGAHVTQAWVTVSFDTKPDETVEEVARLTRELARDLREVGEVEYVPAAGEADAKGPDAVVAAALGVLTASDPVYVQAFVDTVAAFLRRHEGRRARLTVGGVELAIDQPSKDDVASVIELARAAIEAVTGQSTER
jgi:hypothetical protein